MRRFRKAVAVIVLLLLAAFPCSSLADDSPSALALLLQEAFSQPDYPGRFNVIQGITIFHDLVVANEVDFSTWVFYKGGAWTLLDGRTWFQSLPGHASTIFEDACPALGIKRGDLLTFYKYDLTGSFQEYRLSEITSGIPVYDVYRGLDLLRTEQVFAVASMGCTIVMLTSPNIYPTSSSLVANLLFVIPDPSRPGWFPLAASAEDRWTGVSPPVPFRNGVDGFLDSYLSTDEWIVGMELTKNERGALALIIATDTTLHLLEFEPSGTMHTAIPLGSLH